VRWKTSRRVLDVACAACGRSVAKLIRAAKDDRYKVPKSETGRTMPRHSLRHTFGTECGARGVPVPTIKELMGHSDIKTTMRYVTVTQWATRSGRAPKFP
jgi:site-specific recombinase XerD